MLVPQGDLNIPDPRTGHILPKDGKRVALSTYWTRRLREGSVFEVNPTTKKALKNSDRGNK